VCKRYAYIAIHFRPQPPITYMLHILVVAYQITIATGACHMPSNIEISGILLLLPLLLLSHCIETERCLVSRYSLFVEYKNKEIHEVYALSAYHEFFAIFVALCKMQMQIILNSISLDD